MQAKNAKTINIVLWSIQVLLALLFIMTGFMKMLQPIDKLSAMLPWTGQVSPLIVRTLGCIDILGGLGLVLPSLLRIYPKLTVWASNCSIALMFSAIVFHISRGEASVTGFNVIVIFLLALVSWGRTKKVPVYAKA